MTTISRAQAAHAVKFCVISDSEIRPDANRRFLQVDFRVNFAKSRRTFLIQPKFYNVESVEIIMGLPLNIFYLNVQFTLFYVFNSFLRAAGKSTLFSIKR